MHGLIAAWTPASPCALTDEGHEEEIPQGMEHLGLLFSKSKCQEFMAL